MAAGGFGDGLQLLFGGRQQLGAFAGALVGQGGVVAAPQPLTGIVGVSDLEQVLLIEQRQLQRPVLEQDLDLRGAQRADPIQVRRTQLVTDARGSEHAPIAHQGDAGQPEPGFELVDLSFQSFRVGGVALEHLDGHRRSLG